MSSIKILPDHLINKIAAGEVVERPASVVKELIENALDAGATEIFVDVEQAGKRLIRIADNGCGMSRADAEVAFLRHATSKISSEQDLEEISTMGFRGEALSSIASVAQVRLMTAQQGASEGTLLEIDGGVVKALSGAAASTGTTIEVRHLFYNTPARLKFLKSPATEISHIIDTVSHEALSHPPVRFRLVHDKKTVLDLPAATSLRERAFQLLGPEVTGHLRELSGMREPVRVFGLIGNPAYSRGDKTHQEFYVNGRYIRNASLSHALYQAYSDLLMRDRHPVGYLFLELPPSLVDVNVHPTKAEVRFRSPSQIHDFLRELIRDTLRGMPSSSDKEDGLPDRDESVREAGEDYLASPATTDKGAPNPHFFGRRKSDVVVSRPQVHEPAPAKPVSVPLPSFAKEALIPLAQLHNSFILAQSSQGLALIDQHAAHERVLYERLQDRHDTGELETQKLLIPVQLELNPADRERLQEHLPDLAVLGFLLEEFGGGTFLIKEVPALLAGGDYKQLFFDIVDEIKTHGKFARVEALRNDLFAVMACHPAIKVHKRLSLREMEELIRDLLGCRMPHSCPHGRPTIFRISMDEIRKMFKRS